MAITILSGHCSEETAYLIEDYPCGFSKRCKKRIWIESPTKGAGKGRMRVVSQTTNPKYTTDVWNKPKAGVFCDFLMLYRDEDSGHILQYGMNLYTYKEWEEFKGKWYSLMPTLVREQFNAAFPERLMENVRLRDEVKYEVRSLSS